MFREALWTNKSNRIQSLEFTALGTLSIEVSIYFWGLRFNVEGTKTCETMVSSAYSLNIWTFRQGAFSMTLALGSPTPTTIHSIDKSQKTLASERGFMRHKKNLDSAIPKSWLQLTWMHRGTMPLVAKPWNPKDMNPHPQSLNPSIPEP